MRGKSALVMLTRAPEPGRTKTRMMPDLTARQCAELHKSSLRDMSAMCGALPSSIDVFVAFAPEGASALVREAFDAPATYFAQRGDTLGERLSHAAREVVSRGYERCVLVGADSPEMTPDDVLEALDKLDFADMVLGPATDGGFYLAALSQLHDEMFSLPSYGHGQVLQQTEESLEAAGLKVAHVRQVADIDCWEDAQALIERSLSAPSLSGLHTVRYVRGVVS